MYERGIDEKRKRYGSPDLIGFLRYSMQLLYSKPRDPITSATCIGCIAYINRYYLLSPPRYHASRSVRCLRKRVNCGDLIS